LTMRKDTARMDVIKICVGYLWIAIALYALECQSNCFS